MEWDTDFDVKEYHPKKKNATGKITLPSAGADNSARAFAYLSGDIRAYPVTDLDKRDGGFMMTTSEILDFSEGTDSY